MMGFSSLLTLDEASSPMNKIWQAALSKYYLELQKGGVRGSAIDKDLWNIHGPDDLLAQIQLLAPLDATASKTWTTVLGQLKPILLGLNDFAAVVNWAFGMNGKLAAVIWGSIRLIIKV